MASPESEAAGLGAGAKTNLALRGVRGTSAGGGYSTAGDLLRFARALVEGKIVGKETLAALLAPRVRFPVGGDYGYGFVVHRGADGSRIFGHAGGFPGAHGELKIYADGRFTLVALSNVSAGAGDVVAEWDRVASRLAP